MSKKLTGRAAWSPETEARYRANIAAKKAARVEDIEWLIRDDHNAESVARRAGFKNAAAALRFLHQEGRHDLANRLYPFVGNQDVYSPEYGATVHGVAA